MGHTASAHDSAWKSTALYRSIRTYFHPEEYILAGKAYALERHVITPYKEPTARQPPNTALNYELSIPQGKTVHAGLPCMRYQYALVQTRKKGIGDWWPVLFFIML